MNLQNQNHLIWIKISREIKEQIRYKFPNEKSDKFETKSKINLLSDSKLQSNDTGRKIRRKTHNLTQDSDQNDPTDRRIKGFSFCDFEDDCQCSRGKFSLFFRQNLTFNHFINTDMSLE